MADTIADAPAIRRQAPRAEARPAPKPASPLEDLQVRTDDPIMDETVADLEPDAEPAPDVHLDSVFDRPANAIETASLSRYDPEAGRTSVAVKVRAVTTAVKNTVSTTFGKLLITIPVVLAGISLTIAAVTIQDTPYIVAAAFVMPIALVLVYWRYQAWLGRNRYMYRLLETLGEDVSDFDPTKVYRRRGKNMTKRRR